MYQECYYIAKTSGFYQDTLELYGLTTLLNTILNSEENLSKNLIIQNNKEYYSVIIEEFNEEEFKNKVDIFIKNPTIGFDYIFKQTDPKKGGTDFPKELDSEKIINVPFFDINEEWKIIKEFNSNDSTENQKKPNPDFDIYNLLSNFSIEFIGKSHIGGTKQAGMFTRTFLQLFYNKNFFEDFIKGILFLYSNIDNQLKKKNYEKFKQISFPKPKEDYVVISANHKVEKTTFNQLLNPFMSKGTNSEKLKLSESSKEPELLREYLKILGAFNSMFSIGGSKALEDYRVYALEPQKIDFILQKKVLKDFKKSFFTNSSYKSDIYAGLLFSIKLIEHLEIEQDNLFDFDYSPSNYIKGFYCCNYMTVKKSPPKKHAPISFSFIGLPSFIKAKDKESADDWLIILNEFYNNVKRLRLNDKTEESGDIVKGLILFRDFLGSSQIQKFLSYSFWYANYLMSFLSKLPSEQDNRRFYYRYMSFQTETLNKFYINMDTQELNLTEIIKNDGFQAVATAIRKSTISLQYTPKDQRKFEIRYGLAQQLQNKSKSKEDLATFIGEFIGTYNAETGRFAEKNEKKPEPPKAPRATVKDGELLEFYQLLDKNSSRLIGALLASYGFALTSKENVSNQSDDDTESDNEEDQ